MTITEQLQTKRNTILETAARHGVRRLRVFGSVARGETNDRSDVDFLVDMEPGRTLFDLGELYADLQDLLGCPVDLVTEKGISRYIREKVLSEAMPL